VTERAERVSNVTGVIFCIQKTSLFHQMESSATPTRGLLLRRPVEAITPLIPIGKEIERRSLEGEDLGVLEYSGPVKYHPRKMANTRPTDAALIRRASPCFKDVAQAPVWSLATCH
jgi:hypothetical protein